MAIRYDLGAWLAGEKDLEPIKKALIRELLIREVMTETGEDRQTIMDMVAADESMSQEAVLELTSGAPTTLADGIGALIESLEATNQALDPNDEECYIPDHVIDALRALLAYPWPDEEATISTHGANAHIGLRVDMDAHQVTIHVGGQKVYQGDRDDNTLPAVETAAEAVHRAVLARVIGDREHIVQLNRDEVSNICEWSDRPNGSLILGGRLSLNAVEGGGILVRTKPYVYVTPATSRRA